MATAVTPSADDDGGATPFFDSSVNNADQTMKAGAGTIYALEVSNPNATACYLQLFDHAAPTVGTTVPVQSLFVPGSGANDKVFPVGLKFATAIHYAGTTTATGSGNPAVALILSAAYA